MPRADKSLWDHLDGVDDGTLDVQAAVAILQDLANALTDLDGKVVHRMVLEAMGAAGQREAPS
jgi:hypothetical protein